MKSNQFARLALALMLGLCLGQPLVGAAKPEVESSPKPATATAAAAVPAAPAASPEAVSEDVVKRKEQKPLEADRSAMAEILGIVAKEVGKKIIEGKKSPLSSLTGGGGQNQGGEGQGGSGGGGFKEALGSIVQGIAGNANRPEQGGGGGYLGGGGSQRPPFEGGPNQGYWPNQGYAPNNQGYGPGPAMRPNQWEGNRNPQSGLLSGGPLSRPNSQSSLFEGPQNGGFGGGNQRPNQLVGGSQYGGGYSDYDRESHSGNHQGGRKPHREHQGGQNGPWNREQNPDMRDTIIRE